MTQLLICILLFPLVSVSAFVPSTHRIPDPNCQTTNCTNGICITIPAGEYQSEERGKIIIRRVNSTRCQCKEGFAGIYCELSVCAPLLEDKNCNNGGVCQVNTWRPHLSKCRCIGKWSGPRCTYKVLVMDFDSLSKDMDMSGDLRIEEGMGARGTKKYGRIDRNQNLEITSNRLGVHGLEYCLSFAYLTNNAEAKLEIYASRRRLVFGANGFPIYANQRKVIWSYSKSTSQFGMWNYHRSTLIGLADGQFNIVGSTGDSDGYLAIDEIRGEWGRCKD